MLTNSEHHQLTHANLSAEFSKIERYIMSQYADLAQVMNWKGARSPS